MSRILILYGTTDGQTARIAEFLAEAMRAEGAMVDEVNAGTMDVAPSPSDYDGVIVAASVHVGGVQRAVRAWAKAHAPELMRRPTAFLLVCLGMLEHDPAVTRDLERIIARFRADTGWTPGFERLVAGAMPFTRYPLWKRLMMRWIVRKVEPDLDIHRDYEYTDWEMLRRLAREFHQMTLPA